MSQLVRAKSSNDVINDIVLIYSYIEGQQMTSYHKAFHLHRLASSRAFLYLVPVCYRNIRSAPPCIPYSLGHLSTKVLISPPDALFSDDQRVGEAHVAFLNFR